MYMLNYNKRTNLASMHACQDRLQNHMSDDSEGLRPIGHPLHAGTAGRSCLHMCSSEQQLAAGMAEK
jgi:hypothetical protein